MDNVRYSMNRRRKAKNLFYLLNHAVRNDRYLYTQYGIARFSENYFSYSGATAAKRNYISADLSKHGLKTS
ncbi:MAG: hypothetical protein QNL01_06460 [Akkermansiaceae bacterium]|jgi:hypothetical protein|tara:strand:- start:15630 stop:15842 length:213 start_codon:yes stop_codon:yes gene_type:complete